MSETKSNGWKGRVFRRADPQVMFAIRGFADGSTAYTRVMPKLAPYGLSPAVTKLVEQRQLSGEIPPGDIVRIDRVR
jgi:hypothetical protein